MANLNLLVFLNSYDSSKPSNNPSRSNFKWTRDINGIAASNPMSVEATLAASESKVMFSGSAIKKMIYIESDSVVNVIINEELAGQIKPIVVGTTVYPGIFMLSSEITSLEIANPSTDTEASIYLAAIE